MYKQNTVRINRSTCSLRLTTAIFIGAALAISAALAGSGRAWRARIANPVSAGAGNHLEQNGRPKERVEGEIVTIQPQGFDPAEIARPRGKFALVVDNRSGLDEVTLRLDRENGPRQREAHVPHEGWNWSEVLELEPGRYVLTEANHPNWVCRIIIQP